MVVEVMMVQSSRVLYRSEERCLRTHMKEQRASHDICASRQTTAPATESTLQDLQDPQNTAAATKSTSQGPKCAVHATKSALQGTKCCNCNEICTSRFTKCCACHEICTSRSTKYCACHEIFISIFTSKAICCKSGASKANIKIPNAAFAREWLKKCKTSHMSKSRCTAPATKSKHSEDHRHVQSILARNLRIDIKPPAPVTKSRL